MRFWLLLAALLACGAAQARLNNPPSSPTTVSYKSGNYYGSNIGGSSTYAIITTKDRMYAAPVRVEAPGCVATGLGIYISAAGSGASVKGAIYDAAGTGGRPGNRLATATSGVAANTTSTNLDIPLDAAYTLTPGLYWLVTEYTWTTTAPTPLSYNAVYMNGQLMGSSTITGVAGSPGTMQSGVYAADNYASPFPVTFGAATDFTGSGVPMTAFKCQ